MNKGLYMWGKLVEDMTRDELVDAVYYLNRRIGSLEKCYDDQVQTTFKLMDDLIDSKMP